MGAFQAARRSPKNVRLRVNHAATLSSGYIPHIRKRKTRNHSRQRIEKGACTKFFDSLRSSPDRYEGRREADRARAREGGQGEGRSAGLAARRGGRRLRSQAHREGAEG